MVQEPIRIATANGEIVVNIPKNTVALTAEGTPVEEITVRPLLVTPPAPTGLNVVGFATDFGPDGATFNPPIDLTLKIDLTRIPAGVPAEQLVIAWFDVSRGSWVELEDSVVDLATGTVTARVSHFTAFAIIARTATTATPFNIWVVIGPIIGLAVVGGLLYFFFRRRRKIA